MAGQSKLDRNDAHNAARARVNLSRGVDQSNVICLLVAKLLGEEAVPVLGRNKTSLPCDITACTLNTEHI